MLIWILVKPTLDQHLKKIKTWKKLKHENDQLDVPMEAPNDVVFVLTVVVPMLELVFEWSWNDVDTWFEQVMSKCVKKELQR